MPQAYTVYRVASSPASLVLVFNMLLLILYWKNEEIRERKRRGNDEIPFSSLECAKHRPRLKLE